MPLPFLIAGLGIAAGALGLAGHSVAKETNEEAQKIAENAKNLYDKAKMSLECKKDTVATAIKDLEYAKKNILDTSMKQFLRGYERVKHIQIKQSSGLNELDRFIIKPHDALQLADLTNIYESALKIGTGAVAGSVAGTSILAGTGALLGGGIAGALAGIVAPVLFISALSASFKADENLEKAKVMYAEAEAAAETMSVLELKCDAIIQKTEMFNELLMTLNSLFAECARYLDSVTKKKKGFLGLRKITPERLNEQEINLIAISRALAGAIKSIIDTPILNRDGDVSDQSTEVYTNIDNKLSEFVGVTENALTCDYNVKLLPLLQVNKNS